MFKFNFAGENSEESAPETRSELVPAQLFGLDLFQESRISYTRDALGIPRRDLFDVRYELMSRDEVSEEEQILLSTEDVRKTVYEGGLKVWEGTNDLLAVLENRTEEYTNCIELGCGAGIPLCYLFHKALVSAKPGKYVFADYNSAVLRLLTIPNVVLSWLAATKNSLVQEEHGELELSNELVKDMAADLQLRNITLQFVAGAWSPQFSELVGDGYDLVLASETIYSLDSIQDFTAVMQRALGGVALGGVALVAAKKIYFGVGGGVVEFEQLLDERHISHRVVYECGSVGRVVLECQAN